MTATISFADGTVATVPVGQSGTVKFEWDTRSDDGFKTVHNEEAFALADVTEIALEHDPVVPAEPEQPVEAVDPSVVDAALPADPPADPAPAGDQSVV